LRYPSQEVRQPGVLVLTETFLPGKTVDQQ
jgi:hypothetical protein